MLWSTSFPNILKVSLPKTKVKYFQLNENFVAGVAIGNGYLDVYLLGSSLLHFYYYHGIVSSTDYFNLLAKCCPGTTDYRHCDIERSRNSYCLAARSHLLLKATVGGINPYNIYDVCAKVPHNGNASTNSVPLDYVSKSMIYESLNLTLGDFYEGGAHTPVCADHEYLVKYLNSAAVKKALHVDSRAWDWASCRSLIGYSRQFNSMNPQVKHMVNADLKV